MQKGMACRIGVRLVPLVAPQVIGSDQAGTETHGLCMRLHWVVHVDVDLHLLRRAIGPVRRSVVRGELNPDPPFAGRIDDGVKRLVIEDLPIQHSRPKRALALQTDEPEVIRSRHGALPTVDCQDRLTDLVDHLRSRLESR